MSFKIKVKRIGKHYWITDSDDESYGPYDMKDEALEDAEGLKRFHIEDQWEREEEKSDI